jgi:hypothetical protein
VSRPLAQFVQRPPVTGARRIARVINLNPQLIQILQMLVIER